MQETHIAQETNIKLYSKDFPIWLYGDSSTRRAKEVAIGFTKMTRFVLIDRLTDVEGRYLFLKGRLGDRTLTLANVYCPNKNPIRYLKQVLGSLMDFKTGEVILAGDFNFCMDPSLDSTSQKQGMSKALLKMIRLKMFQCQIMDVWRVQHAKTHDYAFFSHVHILVDHSLLDHVRDTKIEINTLSDHSPVSMMMRFPGIQRKLFT